MLRNFWKRKRNRSWTAVILAVVVAGFLLWRIIPNNEKSLIFEYDASALIQISEPTGQQLSSWSGLKVISGDERLTFSADLEAQLFTVTDKRNGLVWRSSPDTSKVKDLNELSRKIAASPILLSYTPNYREILTASLLNEQSSWKAFPIDQGLQLHYTIENLQLSFVVEMKLTDNGLEITIPDTGINETGTFGLASISVFPMFGAAKQGDSGYIVIPDGSGALTYFNKPHTLFENRGYSKWVYGMDPTFDASYRPEIGEQVTMPVFGMIQDQGGFVEMITAGAGDSMIYLNPPGAYNLNYYRGGLDFVFRKLYITRLGAVGRAVPRIEKNRIHDDRRIRFDFIANPDATYADIAKVVRNYYTNTWKTDKALDDNSMRIQLFMGAGSRGDNLSNKTEVMTTFNEARLIAERLKQTGIEQFSIGIKGWYHDGYTGSLPDKFPADAKFGGSKGLEQLTEWMKEERIALSLEDNYLDIYHKEDDGVHLRTESVRQPNGELYLHHPLFADGWYRFWLDWHRLSPYVVDKKYRGKDIQRLKDLGVSSIDLRHAGEILFSDYNPKSPTHRVKMKQIYDKWLMDAKQKLGSVNVYTGNDYAVRYADRILEISQSISNDYLLDEQIPFIQMVYHGLKVYYTEPVNRTDVPQRELLKALEYGAIPSFELTYRPTNRLKFTHYDRLYSSQYEQWMPEVEQGYEMWKTVLYPLRNQLIINHRKEAFNVYATTYEDGTTVWVNYGESVYKNGDVSVDPIHYSVQQGAAAK